MKNLEINNRWVTGLIVLLVVINLVYAGYFIEDAFAGHNMISNLVMAAAPINGLGLPYMDYWDIYPPGIYMFLSPFEFFFHGETIVFKIIHVFFSIIIGVIVLKFLIYFFHKQFHSAIPITLFFILYLLLSNYFYTILFHNAFLALLFSCCGLYLLSFSKKSWIKYLLSTLLFAFSASIKETYLVTVFLPLLYISSRYLLREKKSIKLFVKRFLYIITGIVLLLLLNYTYLKILGINDYYKEVSAFKSQTIGGNSIVGLFNTLNPFNLYHLGMKFKELNQAFFNYSNAIIYSIYLMAFLMVLIPFRIQKVNGNWRNKSNTWSHDEGMKILIFGFLLLHFEGFQLLNKYGPNYTLQMVPSLLLAIAFMYYQLDIISKKYLRTKSTNTHYVYKTSISTFIILCFIWLSNPRIENFCYYKFLSLKEYTSGLCLKKPKIVIPEKVKKHMNDDNRVLYIYGWGTPYYYYFSNTKPFTRFYIIHPSILGEKQIQEFVQQFKKELPKVVMYTETYSDMNTQEFERKVIELKSLLTKCYEFYPTNSLSMFHCEGYYLLKDENYFKQHLNEFIAKKFL